MNYKVSELEGALLDAAVAKCEGAEVLPGRLRWPEPPSIETGYRPSEDWSDGGPIIERERLRVEPAWNLIDERMEPDWQARRGDRKGDFSRGATPLIAAMRAYVASKFGDEVAIP